jgi:stage V sporulation protein D (sporulation-specific penicillin-binding protein)
MAREMKKQKTIGLESMQLRMIVAFAIIVLLFAGLICRIGWIQVVNADTYADKAAAVRTKDQILTAKRGEILDRNMKKLAISTGSYRVFIRLKPYKSESSDPEIIEEKRAAAADILSQSLGIDRNEIVNKMQMDAGRVSIAKDVTKEQEAEIQKAIKAREEDMDEALGIIEMEAVSNRQYPLGAFAAHILGSVNRDNEGQSGIELAYDRYLTGTSGRRIMNTDVRGNPLIEGEQVSYAQQDGKNVILTIDESIQYYAEEGVTKTYENSKAEKVECIVMDPKTGDILAMAACPEFDPNDAGTPLGEEAQARFAQMTDEEQTLELNKMWRNPIVSDLYEPGSVFKLVTISAGLETGVITPDSHVTCQGSYQVGDRTIKCWYHPRAHGDQTITQAVGNSCNPAMMQVVQKLGYDRFYQYLELFGMRAKTGIDFPGEASPLPEYKVSNPVDLATMSFGMGLNITPIEMANAVCAISNGGNLMQPRLVKAISDAQGNIVEEFPTKVVRQVISKQTADEVRNIMEYVAERENNKNVVGVPGYRIGIKTGTAQKLVNGLYSTTEAVGSIVATVPIDNPRFVILVLVDNPEIGRYGIDMAGPALREITEEILRYLNIKPEYTEEERAGLQNNAVTVPELKSKTASEAQNILSSMGLNYSVQGEPAEENFTVADQYPAAGVSVSKGSTVYLYSG